MMEHFRHILASLVAVLLIAAAAPAPATPEVADSAYGEGAHDGDDPRVETRLVLDAEQVRPGQTVRVGVLYTLDPDWHVYWRNSGEAGLPTDTEFDADNASFEDLRWPAPSVFADEAGEVYTFGYGGEVLFFAEATVDADASGSLEVEAEVDYLACKVECIPGRSMLTASVPVADQATPADADIVELFDAAGRQVPRTADELGVEVDTVVSQDAVRPDDEFRAAISLDPCPEGAEECAPVEIRYDHRKYAFIPDSTFGADIEVLGLQAHPEREHARVIQMSGRASPNAAAGDERLSGVVHLERSDGSRVALLVDAPFARAAKGAEVGTVESPLLAQVDDPAQVASAAQSAESAGGGDDNPAPGPIALWKALLLAFLGGMILNLMPCVFPVLAIKVSSFTRLVHESKASILSHGMAYTAGIVGSMLTLALAVLALRAAGTQVGWGFQFQEPLFIAALSAILVLFALNLFGVFQVSVSPNELSEKTHQAEGLRRSFGEGVLAVILATPCSAPFLGTAVGFALASSAATILGIFAMLGLGLAAPFVVLTLSPGWAKILPKPGAWMDLLKDVLGFALLGTVIWLFWILGQMSGPLGTVQMLVFLTTLALAAWFFGKIQYRVEGAKKWGLTLLAAAVVAAVGVYTLQFERVSSKAAAPAPATSESIIDGEIQWREWTEEAVQEELEAGNKVFVDFTADWCITCKVNERTIIDTEPVKDAIADNGVVTFKADWTNPDERIRKKLSEHGKGGVPMYLVYDPDRPDQAEVLPEVLTKDLLVEAFAK